MTVAAVIVAAGKGVRAGGEKPKQYREIAGRPVISWALKAFCDHPEVDFVQPVIGEAQHAFFTEAAAGFSTEPPVIGGLTRQDSCRIGLEAVAHRAPRLVLIHDAARPFVTRDLISRVIRGLEQHQGVVPGLKVTETLKRAPQGLVESTVDRHNLWAAQTPQGFDYGMIVAAHRKAVAEGIGDFTDDAQVAAHAGMAVAMIEGEADNRKITTERDFTNLTAGDFRTGQGIDIHGFSDGDHVVLCGVRIPHSKRLAGHSDADVGLHALADAIFGSIGESDIGTHFPPTDPRWKGADSRVFVARAIELLTQKSGRIVNADITILAEAPRVAPHIPQMKQVLTGLLGIDDGRVAIKATTTEGLGFIGRGEGIVALATVTVRLPG